jgi:hypothetical protein
MKRQYPAFPEEAFESAEGRIYPLFSSYGEAGQKFVKPLACLSCWDHYRAIDFGAVDPFVCLWACVVPADPPGLTVDPSCENLIREMLAYSYDSNGSPKDRDNHAPDALRYLITSAGLDHKEKHLHVYRELYMPNSVKQGFDVAGLARRVKELSGTQRFKLTVADRSRPDSILTLNLNDVRAVAASTLSDHSASEIVEGVSRVNALIVATARPAHESAPPPKPERPKPPRLDFRVREGQVAAYG